MSNFRDKLFVSKQKGPFDLHYYSNSFKKKLDRCLSRVVLKRKFLTHNGKTKLNNEQCQ